MTSEVSTLMSDPERLNDGRMVDDSWNQMGRERLVDDRFNQMARKSAQRRKKWCIKDT